MQRYNPSSDYDATRGHLANVILSWFALAHIDLAKLRRWQRLATRQEVFGTAALDLEELIRDEYKPKDLIHLPVSVASAHSL